MFTYEEREVLGVFGVVLIEEPARGERVVHAVADRMAQFGIGHAAMKGESADDVHIVDAGLGSEIEYRLDDALADIGPLHLGQRQAHIVECDREPHSREQLRGERVLVDGVQ